MSGRSRGFFDVVKEALQEIAPGLKTAAPEITAELARLGTQGTMELASALFNGNAFVPYGPGQYTPTPDAPAPEAEAKEQTHVERLEQEREQERGGMER